jgi:hypothetical protein
MKVPERVSIVTAWVFLIVFCLTAGVMLIPLYFCIVVVAVLLGVTDVEEAPVLFWEFVTLRWLLEDNS